MALLRPEEFLRQVIREEPQTTEGMVAKHLLHLLETDPDLPDPETVFEEHRTALLNQLDVIESLQSQFNREQNQQEQEE